MLFSWGNLLYMVKNVLMTVSFLKNYQFNIAVV